MTRINNGSSTDSNRCQTFLSLSSPPEDTHRPFGRTSLVPFRPTCSNVNSPCCVCPLLLFRRLLLLLLLLLAIGNGGLDNRFCSRAMYSSVSLSKARFFSLCRSTAKVVFASSSFSDDVSFAPPPPPPLYPPTANEEDEEKLFQQ